MSQERQAVNSDFYKTNLGSTFELKPKTMEPLDEQEEGDLVPEKLQGSINVGHETMNQSMIEDERNTSLGSPERLLKK